MQGTKYLTSNLVMLQLYEMITKLEMPTITYVHTARQETISIDAALEEAVRPDMMKRINTETNTHTSSVQTRGSRTTACGQRASTFRMHSYARISNVLRLKKMTLK